MKNGEWKRGIGNRTMENGKLNNKNEEWKCTLKNGNVKYQNGKWD